MSFSWHSAFSSWLSASRSSREDVASYASKNEILGLGSLGAILRAALLAASNTYRVQSAADYVIAHSRQIFHTAAANEHDRVLLKIVANTGDISCDFDSIGQTHSGDFTQRRVRLLRSLRVDAGAYAALLRTSLQRRTGRLVPRTLASVPHQLIEGRHSCNSLSRAVQPHARKACGRRNPQLRLFPDSGSGWRRASHAAAAHIAGG